MATKASDLHYSPLIQWEPHGQVYVVSVPELAGLHTHGKTYEEAVRQARDAIATWVLDEDPATLPEPRVYQVDEVITKT